jgi:hypothetical protein
MNDAKAAELLPTAQDAGAECPLRPGMASSPGLTGDCFSALGWLRPKLCCRLSSLIAVREARGARASGACRRAGRRSGGRA